MPNRTARPQNAPAASKLTFLLLPLFLAFASDQLSKYWILYVIQLPAVGVVDVLSPYLRFVMAWNEGVNFGIGHGANAGIWITLSLLISAGLLYWSSKMTDRLGLISVGLLVGGALGNALDRAVFGAVVDFLNTSCCGFNNPYAFNIADIYIFAGAGGLILRDSRKKEPQKPDTTQGK